MPGEFDRTVWSLVAWARDCHRRALRHRREKGALGAGGVRWLIAHDNEQRQRDVADAYLRAAWLIKGRQPMKRRGSDAG